MLAQHMTDMFQKGLGNVLDNGGDISVQSKLPIRSLTSFEMQPGKADFAALSVDQCVE